MARILVVDDEELIRFSFLRPLQREGYTVEAANNGNTALEKIVNAKYDLAVIDLQLDDMDGLDVVRHLRGTSPETKVIVITAVNTPEIRARMLSEGIRGYYEKPFDTYEVVNCIRDCMSESEFTWPVKRQSERSPFDGEIYFLLSVPGDREPGKLGLSAKGINISTGGVCIKTDYPLEPGCLVEFVNGLTDRMGVVQWSNHTEDNSCTAGIRFVTR